MRAAGVVGLVLLVVLVVGVVFASNFSLKAVTGERSTGGMGVGPAASLRP